MSFELKKRKYDSRYLLLLPFQCEPSGTVGTLLQKLSTGIICTLWIVLEAALIDRALACMAGRDKWRELLFFLPIMLFMVCWKRMGYTIGRFLTIKAEVNIPFYFQREIVKKCSRVSYRILEERRFWELKYSLMQQIERITWMMLQQTGNFILFMARVLGICLLLFLENAWCSILVLLFMPPFLYLSLWHAKGQQEDQGEQISCKRRYLDLDSLLRGRSAVEERTLFAYTGYVQRMQQKQTERMWNILWRAMKKMADGNAAEAAALGMVLTLVTVFRISLLAEGKISLGAFIALSKGLCDMASFLRDGVSHTFDQMEVCLDFLKDLTSFAAMPETEGTNELPSKTAERFQKLQFQKVSFRYPGTARYVLKDLNMTLVCGGHYAFVGENGAGKTTIAKLLTGVYDSYEGSILLNGTELRDYAPERRKAMFAAVYQDSARYDDTAAVNILLGNTADMGQKGQRHKMEQAAGMAGIYDFITELKDGFDTLLGKQAGDGVELSDGHWQKIIMARLFMNPAPFYIFDEPAAVLDPIAESRLYEKFEQISKDKTTLSISHRLGSTRRADKIFVLKEGRVAEEGSHKELMESQKEWYQK